MRADACHRRATLGVAVAALAPAVVCRHVRRSSTSPTATRRRSRRRCPISCSTAIPPTPAKLARLAKRESTSGVTPTATSPSRTAWRRRSRRGSALAHTSRSSPTARGSLHRPARASPAPGTLAPPLTVAYAGHLYPWKGVDVLLEAIARVPAVQGLVIGGHEKEDGPRAAARACDWPGHREPGDVRRPAAAIGGCRLARQADVLALPNPASAISTHSTSPLKLFEYMAAGKAIVASNLPAIREVLTDEITALLVTPGDPRSARCGHPAAGTRPRASRPARRRGVAAAVAEYSWDRRAERLEALFTNVIAARR